MSIIANGITKTFGRYKALDNVDLVVPSGKLVALLGPSGSGKTTLLRIIAGLEFADEGSGRIEFHGEDVSKVSAGERGVGFVFQHYALFRHMTVFENIAFGLRVRPRAERPTENKIAERVGELLRLVQLDGLDRRFPSQLSGGQRQRIALARALAVEPSVLLLDEPFSALDPFTRASLHELLLGLWQELRPTILMVTHDVDEAVFLADRIVVMRPKPGRVHETISVNLPRPRDRISPVFDTVKRRIMHAIDRSLGEQGRVGLRPAAGGHSPWW